MSSMGILAAIALFLAVAGFILNAVVVTQFEGRISPPNWSFLLNKVLIFCQWSGMIFVWLVLILVILHSVGVHPHLRLWYNK